MLLFTVVIGLLKFTMGWGSIAASTMLREQSVDVLIRSYPSKQVVEPLEPLNHRHI